MGKTMPEVLNTARGRRPRAVLKAKGTVFPNTDRPRLEHAELANQIQGFRILDR